MATMSSFREIARIMDSVETSISLRELINLHRWTPAEEQSFKAICNRHDSSRKLERNFLFINTYLLDVWFGGEASKPAVSDRARAIGELIEQEYDIALLAEVFEDNVKDLILEAWSSHNQPYVRDDSRRRTDKSSGLVTISQQEPLDEKIIHEYTFESGSDRLADKGVMLTLLDFGFGDSKLELYNTHLNSGNDRARKFQVLELVSFIERTHNENNVAILAGDFNINALCDERNRETNLGAFCQGERYRFNPYMIASGGGGISPDFGSINPRFANYVNERLFSGDYPEGMSEYDVLLELLNLLGFHDIWTHRNRTPGYTSNMDDISVANLICLPDDVESQYCDDFNVPLDAEIFSEDDRKKFGRIDIIFMGDPLDSHTFALDVIRPRRVRAERRADAPERDKIAFLSDHLGLATKLLISPK